jgi:hypothetical protein
MRKVQELIKNYRRFVQLPWSTNISGRERVWFAVYPPPEERKVRAQLKEFEVATIDAKKKWYLVDITSIISDLISKHDYIESYFNMPEAVESIEDDIEKQLMSKIKDELQSTEADDNTVVAVIGTSTLFGFAHISSIVAGIEDVIKGRILIFFPGVYDNNQYRFMDARDGFNYMAVPITSDGGMLF